jgi:hypothetical protein
MCTEILQAEENVQRNDGGRMFCTCSYLQCLELILKDEERGLGGVISSQCLVVLDQRAVVCCQGKILVKKSSETSVTWHAKLQRQI